MVHESALDEEFFASLTDLDEELARTVAAEGCPRCGGPLHRADYQRKPRGALIAGAAEAFTRRHSLCCGRAGCRRRALPPSLRFLGRKVYVELVVLFASVVAQLADGPGRAETDTGVPRRTLGRWRHWWTKELPSTAAWLELRARLAPPPPSEAELPASLAERLARELDPAEATVVGFARAAARHLAASTTSSVPDGSRFVRSVFGRIATVRFTQRMPIPGDFSVA
jgi:hypothetical protein